jgi:hypothetical protein
MNPKTVKIIVHGVVSAIAIVALWDIQTKALAAGIDGTLMILIMGGICGLAGFNIKKIYDGIKPKSQDLGER